MPHWREDRRVTPTRKLEARRVPRLPHEDGPRRGSSSSRPSPAYRQNRMPRGRRRRLGLELADAAAACREMSRVPSRVYFSSPAHIRVRRQEALPHLRSSRAVRTARVASRGSRRVRAPDGEGSVSSPTARVSDQILRGRRTHYLEAVGPPFALPPLVGGGEDSGRRVVPRHQFEETWETLAEDPRAR